MSGGGQVAMTKKFYQVVVLTPHKIVYAEDQQRYSESVSKWEKASSPRLENFVKNLEKQGLDQELEKLGAVDPNNISRYNEAIAEDGSYAPKKENGFYELRIKLDGLAASIHSVEVESLKVVFKVPPAKEKIVEIVQKVKKIFEQFKAQFPEA